MKNKKINTCYDQFGGHSSGKIQTVKVRSDYPKGVLGWKIKQSEQNKPLYDRIAKKLNDLFADPAQKKQWQRDIKDFQQNKAVYDKKKAAGRKVKPEDDPFPLDEIIESEDFSLIDPVKHLPAFKAILAIFHKRYYCGLGRIISKDTVAIWPEINKIAFSAKLLERFFEYTKPTDNNDIQGKDKRKPGRPRLPETEQNKRNMILRKWAEEKEKMSQRQFCEREKIKYLTSTKNYLKTCQDWECQKRTN